MEVKNAVMPNETQLKEFNDQGEDKGAEAVSESRGDMPPL